MGEVKDNKVVELEFEEKLEYYKKLKFVAPQKYSERELDMILTNIERECDSLSDYIFLLCKYGFTPFKESYIEADDYSSPHSTEVSCIQFEWVDEEKK